MNSKRLVGIVLGGLLCACSGGTLGNQTNPLPGTPPLGASSAGAASNLLPDASRTMLEVKLTVPPKTAAADFVSPNTQSIRIKEQQKLIGSFATTRKAKGCKYSSTKGTQCTFLMSAIPGEHRIFTIDTYSRAHDKGQRLADARVIATIRKNKINNLKLTLNGIVSSIVVGLSEPQPILGTATTMQVVVSAIDASGATIVGAGNYVPSISLSDSDTSGATRLSQTVVKGPSTSVTLAYNGANIANATIDASAAGIPAAHITPGTMRPTSKAGVTVSGAAAFSVISDASGDAAAYIPISSGLAIVKVASHGTLSAVHTNAESRAVRPLSTLPLPNPPDECAPDLVHAQLYCLSFTSAIVSVVHYNPANVLATPTLLGTTTTDAPSTGVSFSGATCVICGIAFDPTDNAFIISTANGYELWSTSPGATVPLKTIPAPISENFGYNAITDQIFSAWYGSDPFDATLTFNGLDLIDIPSSSRYQLNDSSIAPFTPDAAAFDTKTNIGIAPEEDSYPVYMDDLNAPAAVYTAPTPVPYPLPSPYTRGYVGSYTSPVATPNPASSFQTNLCPEETYTSVDSVEDLGFFGSEYCANDWIAVAQLPTAAGAMLAFSNYVAAQLPNTPAGAFQSPLDPHAILVVNLPNICPDCGVLFNYDKSYIAVVDLNAFLALNPGGGELDVPSGSSLSGIVSYIATGVSSPPSAIVRKLAEANRHRRKNR
jgi:hypothetical protein